MPCDVHREAGGGPHSHDQGDARGQGLLHDFERSPSGDGQNGPAQRKLTGQKSLPYNLVHGIVPPYVLVHRNELPVFVEAPGCVDPTRPVKEALVGPKFKNAIRYHGVLAIGSAHRATIVPAAGAHASKPTPTKDCPLEVRSSWARLLRRVFDFDVSVCPACGGPMRIIAAVLRKDGINKILAARGLPADSPGLCAAAPPELDFTDAA